MRPVLARLIWPGPGPGPPPLLPPIRRRETHRVVFLEGDPQLLDVGLNHLLLDFVRHLGKLLEVLGQEVEEELAARLVYLRPGRRIIQGL